MQEKNDIFDNRPELENVDIHDENLFFDTKLFSLCNILVVTNLSVGVFLFFVIFIYISIWFSKDPDNKDKLSQKIKRSIALVLASIIFWKQSITHAQQPPENNTSTYVASTMNTTNDIEGGSSSNTTDENGVERTVTEEDDFFNSTEYKQFYHQYKREKNRIRKKFEQEKKAFEKETNQIEQKLNGIILDDVSPNGKSTSSKENSAWDSSSSGEGGSSSDSDNSEYTPVNFKIVSGRYTTLAFQYPENNNKGNSVDKYTDFRLGAYSQPLQKIKGMTEKEAVEQVVQEADEVSRDLQKTVDQFQQCCNNLYSEEVAALHKLCDQSIKQIQNDLKNQYISQQQYDERVESLNKKVQHSLDYLGSEYQIQTSMSTSTRDRLQNNVYKIKLKRLRTETVFGASVRRPQHPNRSGAWPNLRDPNPSRSLAGSEEKDPTCPPPFLQPLPPPQDGRGSGGFLPPP